MIRLLVFKTGECLTCQCLWYLLSGAVLVQYLISQLYVENAVAISAIVLYETSSPPQGKIPKQIQSALLVKFEDLTD